MLHIEVSAGHATLCHIPLKKSGKPCRTDRDGYSVASTSTGEAKCMHKRVYERVHGKVPIGMVVDHLCGNRACCNPDHLEAVTPRENVRRSRRTRLTPEHVERIKEMRKTMGPSAISRLIGISQSHISHICAGHYWREDGKPSYRTIRLRQAKACAVQ